MTVFINHSIGTKTVETKTYTCVINRSQLLAMLYNSNPNFPVYTAKDLKVYIEVPGGGDRSNMDLDLDDNKCVIYIQGKVTTEKES